MDILIESITPEEQKPLIEPSQLVFGRCMADRMFTMRYTEGHKWSDARVCRYAPFEMDAAACCLHYSQEIFEGMKAYASPDGRILLFRPEENAARMNRSAARMCMPEIPVEVFLSAVTTLVSEERRWIPTAAGTSLYIRPAMIGTEAALGVHPSSEYIFFILIGPVGAYYKAGFKPIPLWVEEEFVRAAVGGTGEAKTGGNYAATLLAAARAQAKGFAQVMWLDANQRRYVEEVGSMNMFFVFDRRLVTPALTGSVLPGITRKSVIELAPAMGLQVEERLVSIEEVIEGISTGHLTEAFGSGTAAVISPVGSLRYKNNDYVIGDAVGPVTQSLFDTLTGIQYGVLPDERGWVREIGRL